MRLAVTSMLALAVLLAGCGKGNPADEVDAWEGELPISGPWLRESLPDEVIAYLRVPHPVGLVAMPKGNILDAALGSEANITHVTALTEALVRLLDEDLARQAGPLATVLFEQLRSPVEIAVIGGLTPSALIGTTLNTDSTAELESVLDELAPAISGRLNGPIDAEGFGVLNMQGSLPIQLHFDEAAGRFTVLVGLLANEAAIRSAVTAAGAPGEHPMHALEQDIDSSGQGYFAWVDAQRGLATGASALPPGTFQMLAMLGMDGVRSLAVGAGTANGKGRLKLAVDLGDDGADRPFPVVENAINALSVGEPRSLLLLSVPGADEFSRLESLALSLQSPDATSDLRNAKELFAGTVGFSVEELLASIGPEILYISDRAGDYMALRVRDSQLLSQVLDQLVASAGISIQQRDVDGLMVRHAAIPASIGFSDEILALADVSPFPVLTRMNNHVYWVEDQDYLYIAGIPQVLIDRERMEPSTRVADWLSDTQRIDLTTSMFGATGSLHGVPKLSYQAYLGGMQVLADIVDAEYDVFAMPTAYQLGLPDSSTLGVSLNLGNPIVSLELTYENHPFEVLYGMGGMSVATVGMMAAIAIPAYQDYTIRVQVSESLSLAAMAKAAVAESYIRTGVAPADRNAAGMTANPEDTSNQYVRAVDVFEGKIIISYGNAAHAQISGLILTLTPYVSSDDSIVWVCGNSPPPSGAELLGEPGVLTTVPAQYLPTACR